MVGVGLVLKSFQRLTQVDLGFHPDGVTSIALPLRRRIAVDTGRIKTFVNAVGVPAVASDSCDCDVPRCEEPSVGSVESV